jgi:hypothetical protein
VVPYRLSRVDVAERVGRGDGKVSNGRPKVCIMLAMPPVRRIREPPACSMAEDLRPSLSFLASPKPIIPLEESDDGGC